MIEDLPPFLRIPVEIRFQIYEILLASPDHPSLSIRTEHVNLHDARKSMHRRRTKYRHMADRFRARTMESTYFLSYNPGIDASILCTNRQLHREASHVLYSSHVFDFGMDVESVVPFLSDLTPIARSSIKSISLIKRALPYTKDFDNCEWRNACAYISSNIRLTELELMIEAGREEQSKEFPQAFSSQDFDDKIMNYESMQWAKDLSAVRDLDELKVTPLWQHCPPPSNSRMMAFFVQFSASLEGGFSGWMKEAMLKKHQQTDGTACLA